jgi:drug/metabolite transporter (DMT)-like permease
MNIVPFATAIFSILFGEQIELYHLTSGGLILIGIIYFQGIFKK